MHRDESNTATPWWRGERGEFYLLLQAIFFLLLVFGPARLPGIPLIPGPRCLFTAIGSLLMIAGALIALSGTISLGRNLTPLPMPKENSLLVIHGIYRFIRHPIYSGIIFMAYGYATICRSWLTLAYASLLLIFFEIKSRREEMWLLAKFPDYAEYRRHTGRFIPFLH
jgi:protein-S-isoprenylcysteine O-methyltransferase Ste14